jgi:uncharacterized protein YjeT (DUF2065 family)
MKRFTSTECGALILAAMLILAGLTWLLWPREMITSHPTNNEVGWPGGFTGLVSKAGSRLYGAVAIIVGAGLAYLAAYRNKP